MTNGIALERVFDYKYFGSGIMDPTGDCADGAQQAR